MLALSIRQPYAELILRGIKTVELRTRRTTIVGERFYICACKSKAKQAPIWSRDLRAGTLPECMIELAEQIKLIPPGTIEGGASHRCHRRQRGHREGDADARLFPMASDRHRADKDAPQTQAAPQPVWFKPF